MKKYSYNFYSFNQEGTNHNSLRMFGINIYSFYYRKGFGWFRILGVGLHWKDTTVNELMFSERNGNIKGLQIYKWRIIYLPK